MSFLFKWQCRMSVPYFPQCHISNLFSYLKKKKKKSNLKCPMSLDTTSLPPPSPDVACHQALCRMSNLRNAHVALSVLGVKGHSGAVTDMKYFGFS